MTPWFVLSYPRCRTAWLSVFLSGAGVPCFHEAWKRAKTAKELRALMGAQQAPVVVNSDCSNVFFLKELREEFPDARFLTITNSDEAILSSLKESYGELDYTEMMQMYRAAFSHATGLPGVSVDCLEWDQSVSAWLFEHIAGIPVNQVWIEQVSGMLVQLMPWQIRQDVARAAAGEFDHIANAMKGASWV